ncbi:MAG: hypothetical protein WKF84_26525 [Pyrinomonadaceae bacterium]
MLLASAPLAPPLRAQAQTLPTSTPTPAAAPQQPPAALVEAYMDVVKARYASQLTDAQAAQVAEGSGGKLSRAREPSRREFEEL